ncbi:hypothetical protein [Polynucleobacter sp. KF022]|uniref:hypothetical protein n=1 Tax=Polynucleobacter sp. KF022 TaxID=2982615 RepID=UPI0023778C6C|nr:hypothetical protein [Polynucleobacter sp. KF022]BDT75800.1 hypothetical protein PKF022_14650 [Polynucleobacter sp. KF022]
MSNENTNAFFANQTHFMTVELLNALDSMLWDPNGPEWLKVIISSCEVDDTFTVTAEQAQWIIEQAGIAFNDPECADNNWEDDYALIVNTFDDYACFLRMVESDGDAVRVSIS